MEAFIKPVLSDIDSAIVAIRNMMACEDAAYYAIAPYLVDVVGERWRVGFSQSLCNNEGSQFSEFDEVFRWVTSSGNMLEVRVNGWDPATALTIHVVGRRHGIPWRFVSDIQAGRIISKAWSTWEYVSTREDDLAPWETTTGKPNDLC